MSTIKSVLRKPWKLSRPLHDPNRKLRGVRIVRVNSTIKTGPRVVALQNNGTFQERNHMAPQWKTGVAFFLCYSLQQLDEVVSTQVSALRLNGVTNVSKLQGPFLQPPIIHLTALVGTLLNTGKAALRRKYTGKMKAIFVEAENADDELLDYEEDPSPAEPLILALGLASAMVDTFNPRPKSKSKTPSITSKTPVKLDIDFEEYDVLASILKRTKAATEEFNDKNLDPIRDLLKMKQPDAESRLFRDFIEKFEKKSETRSSFFRHFFTFLSQQGKLKYDWWTGMTELSTPPTYARVLSSWQPTSSKYDMWKDVIGKIQKNDTIQTLPKTEPTINQQSNDVVSLGASVKEFKPSEEVVLEQDLSESRIEIQVPSSENARRLCDEISRINEVLKEVENKVDKLF